MAVVIKSSGSKVITRRIHSERHFLQIKFYIFIKIPKIMPWNKYIRGKIRTGVQKRVLPFEEI